MTETIHPETSTHGLCRPKTGRYHALLCFCVLIFGAALLFRLVKLVLDPGLMRDSTLYLQWAENWYETGDHVFMRLGVPVKTASLPVWLIKTLMLSGFGSEIAGRSLSLFLGSLIPVIGFIAALRACGRIRIALLSAFLLVFHPDLVTYSIQPLRDNYYVFFEAFLLLMTVEAYRNDTLFNWGVCGVFVALQSFCRYEGLEFLLIVPFIAFVLSVFEKERRKRVFPNIAAFFCMFGIASLFLLSLTDFDSGIVRKITDLLKVSYRYNQ